jgi:hypothetical protein
MAVWQGKVRASLDQYRQVMAALDTIDASEIVANPLPQSPDLKFETRALVERMRDAAEDMLFEDHGRLGFESEKPVVVAEESVSPTPKVSPAEVARKARETRDEVLREAVLASDEPTNSLAKRLGVTVQVVSRIRKESGDACAYYSGSKLSPEQREEIAKSTELVSILSERYSIGKVVIHKLRRSGGVL